MPPYGARMGPEGASTQAKILVARACRPKKGQDKGISPGKGRFGSIARGPLGQDRKKMLAIEAPKGPKKNNGSKMYPTRHLLKMFPTRPFYAKTFGQPKFL